jgi:hypothetical protein
VVRLRGRPAERWILGKSRNGGALPSLCGTILLASRRP